MRLLRQSILDEYGEEALISIAQGGGEECNDERQEELATAFRVRMKLRRRLLNRLARRLYRVAYVMDNGDAAPPAPPLYGDEIVRFQKEEGDDEEDEDVRWISKEEVKKFVEGEEKRIKVKEEIAQQRRERKMEVDKTLVKVEDEGDVPAVVSSAVPSDTQAAAVEFILRGDKEDKSLLDQLKEYEVGYDKTTIVSPPEADPKATVETTNPIVNTTDDHEVNEDGEFVSKGCDRQRINFSLIALDKRPIPPRERSVEWKRWNKEISTKIEEQVTFEDIGMGPDKVFDVEQRLEDAKRKREEEANPRGKGKVLRKDGNASENRGRGKELKKEEDTTLEKQNVVDKVEDVTADEMKDPEDSNAKDAEIAEVKPPKRHNRTFSLRPVPSFYSQDMRRVQLIQMELNHSGGMVNIEKLYKKVQLNYDVAFKRSMELQQAKAAAITELQNVVQQQKTRIQEMREQADKTIARSKHQWQNMQQMMHNYCSKNGAYGLQLKLAARDVVNDLVDKVVIREANHDQPNGTKYIRHAIQKAVSSRDESKYAAANILGHMIDHIDRKNTDKAMMSPEYTEPDVETEQNTIDLRTGETLAEHYAKKQVQLKQRADQISKAFGDAEKVRAAAWSEVVKVKAMAENSMGFKAKQRNRKSNASSRSYAPVAAPRPAVYKQQQPGYYNPQVHRPAGQPAHMMSRAPIPGQQPMNIPVQMMAGGQMGMAGQGSAFNRVVLQSSTVPVAPMNSASAATMQPERTQRDLARKSEDGKYNYGDR